VRACGSSTIGSKGTRRRGGSEKGTKILTRGGRTWLQLMGCALIVRGVLLGGGMKQTQGTRCGDQPKLIIKLRGAYAKPSDYILSTGSR